MFCVHDLLWEGRWHGVWYHGRWGWLLGLGRLGCEWELGMVHTILGGPRGAGEGRRLEVLLTAETTHLAGPGAAAKASLSVVAAAVAVVAAAVTASIAAARIASAATTVTAAVLGFVAPKGTLGSTTEPPVVIPTVVTTTASTTTPSPSVTIIPIPSVTPSITASTATSAVRHLDEFGVDGLVGLAEDSNQVAGLFHVVRREEGVGGARFLTAGRASNAVDIVLGGVRVVIIDDKFHIFHICKVLQCVAKRVRHGGVLHTTTTARSKGTS